MTHAERIQSWTKVHPTKTAVVEDILALRSNVAANLQELGKSFDERLGRVEAAATELSDDVTNNVETIDQDFAHVEKALNSLHARVEELEQARFGARVRRVRDRLVAASWRLRLRFHVKE